MDIKVPKNEKGEYVLTEDALNALVADVTKEATEQVVKEAKLTTPGVPTILTGVDITKGAEQRRWKKSVEFFRALASNDIATIKALSEGSAADGGRLVPTEFSTALIATMEKYGVARRYSTVVPMKSKTLNLNTLTGKVTGYWVDEGAAITASSPTYGEPVLTAKKLGGITGYTPELFEDSEINIMDNLLALFAEEFTKKEDNEWFNGDSTVFSGLLYSGVATTNKVIGAQDPASTTYDDLVDLIASLSQGQLAGGTPTFFASRSVLAIMRKIKDGNGQPILLDPRGSMPASLLGYPVEINEVMPTAAASVGASKKFLAFGNPKPWSYFGDRKSITTKILTEGTIGAVKLAEEDEEALRVIERVALVHAVPANIACLVTAA